MMSDVLSKDELEAEAVHYWNIERFCELGYPRHQAEMLERARVDWHDLKLLLKRGCSREQALEILT